jgi:hypothetical protein
MELQLQVGFHFTSVLAKQRQSGTAVSPTKHCNGKGITKTPQDKVLKKLVSETHKRTSTDLTMTEQQWSPD